MSAIYTVKGVGQLLEVYEDKVTIGPTSFWEKGLRSTKTILFSSISAIQIKKPSLMNGYIEFTLPGGNESNRLDVFAEIGNENAFTFKRRQYNLALEIKEYIEKKIQELHKPQASFSSSSIADELQKLADMKEKGILSEEEFQAAKHRLIG